ncbi:cytochrome c [Pedobacter sp. CG_S7]|uniref:c-type cytochrome n=1 Tax=Pedobacter sp. CG_S7 TaxID=3143930 RepID=UPI003391783F
MKRNLMIPLIVIAILAWTPAFIFGQTKQKKATTIVKKAVPKTVVTAAQIEEGKGLLAKSDCMACHKTDVKLIGPAYSDVAKKYPSNEANYNLLASKIIKGGSGVWGQIPMSPHAAINIADAKKIVKYILSLN